MVEFRVMDSGDEGFFMQLMDMVGWGITPDDYRRMLTFSPEGLFIASVDGVDLGMVSTTSYSSIAWVGNLVVLPKFRGMGLGAALMMKAMGYLTEMGAKSIRLDGVPLAIPLYRRLGFKDEYWSLRYTGVARPNEVTMTRPMEADDLSAVEVLDKSVFKGSRHEAIRYVYRINPELAFTSWDGNELIGYIMAKRGKSNVKIGPWICKSGHSGMAEELLYSVMNMVQGEDLWVDSQRGTLTG
jgi:predicted N-acetyltransferase YhbS